MELQIMKMALSFLFILSLLCVKISLGQTASQVNVSDQVSISKSGLIFNRSTNTFNSEVTIKNSSNNQIYGPFLISVNISNPNVSLANSLGLQQNASYSMIVPLQNGVLNPGESISNIVLMFDNPKLLSFGFNLTIQAAT